MNFEQICVTAHLSTPIVGEPTLPLDGILYAQAVRHEMGEPPITSLWTPPQVEMPIEIYNAGPEWFYGCSFAMWESPTASGEDTWVKMARIDEVARYTRGDRLDISKGEYKGYHQPIFYNISRSITWHLLADMAWVESCLLPIHAIGKKRESGWGNILRWDIHKISNETWDEHGPHLRRALPVSYCLKRDGHYPIDMVARRAYRPPYWYPDNMGLTVMDLANGS